MQKQIGIPQLIAGLCFLAFAITVGRTANPYLILGLVLAGLVLVNVGAIGIYRVLRPRKLEQYQ